MIVSIPDLCTLTYFVNTFLKVKSEYVHKINFCYNLLVSHPCFVSYILLHFSLSVKAVTLIFISGRDLAISSTHEGKTGNINGKTEIVSVCLELISINWMVLSRKIRSVLDKYTTFKFKHCEFNPQQRRLFFFIYDYYLRLFFSDIFTFVLERSLTFYFFFIFSFILFSK